MLLIFDLDGTLVDSSRDLTDALNYASLPLGHVPLSVSEVKALVGEGISNLIDKILDDSERARKDEVLARFLDYYSVHLTDFTFPYEGVEDALDRLHSHTLAVVSNKNTDLSRRVLDDLGLRHRFSMVVGSDLSEPKPSPAPLRLVMNELGFSTEQTVMIGDSHFDVRAGRAAGVKVCAVCWGFRDRAFLEAESPDVLVNQPSELLPALSRLGI